MSRSPYIQSFNLAIQRQLTSSVMIESTYAGKIGTKIEALRPINPARLHQLAGNRRPCVGSERE